MPDPVVINLPVDGSVPHGITGYVDSGGTFHAGVINAPLIGQTVKVRLPAFFTGNVGDEVVITYKFRVDAASDSGSTVAGSFPINPASAARSVPCPLPVALKLPYRWTLSPVALAKSAAGNLAQRW